MIGSVDPAAIMNTMISQLRKRYKPERVKVLFVAESPPACDDGEVRFFYNADNERWDQMYRALMKAVFPKFEYFPGQKGKWLRKFQAKGYYLIDATDCPINRLSSAERRCKLDAAVKPKLYEIQKLITPSTPIVLLKKNVFSAFNRPLRDAGYNVIHECFLPFPSHGHQKEFVKKCGDCLRRLEQLRRILQRDRQTAGRRKGEYS